MGSRTTALTESKAFFFEKKKQKTFIYEEAAEMAEFCIEIEPALPPHSLSLTAPIPDHPSAVIDVRRIYSAYNIEHTLDYKLSSGHPYRYYPTDILTVLNDLQLELKTMQSREDRDMTLVGYTVLQAMIRGDKVESLQASKGTPSLGLFSLAQIVEALEVALHDVWCFVQHLQQTANLPAIE